MSITDVARDWAAHDPDPETAAYVLDILEDPARAAELQSRFSGPLTFGTAGLRGEVGAGESRMNRAVVTRATYGLMDWLGRQVERPRVVIGCDARHGSSDFYTTAAEVISAAGGTALLLPPCLPTPVTAFAVRALHADAGIMITASHNPRTDNGYKVYLGGRVATGVADGVQIVPPADAEIMACITEAPPADQIARDASRLEKVDVLPAYLEEVTRLSNSLRDVRIVLTAMHGIGGEVARQALNLAGFNDVHVVEEQFAPNPDFPTVAFPNPDFPTVAFPNPEEPGALDLAIALARDVNADLILALDPDADRCAVAIPTGQGNWRQLSGDETGCLLGDYVAGRIGGGGVGVGVLASSIVSSRLLGAIAADHGLEHRATLTGFKWIARVPDLVFGYEEAIGYCCDPAHVRDKDGITAAVTMALLVDNLRIDGRSIQDVLDSFADRFGLHATAPVTFRVEDVSLISAAMQQLRSTAPTELAGSEVVSVIDLGEGYNGLPPTDGLILLTAANDRVIIRPSGTEPKLKCYLEVILPGGTWEEARKRLDAISEELREVIGL